jgi:hypothetical protein
VQAAAGIALIYETWRSAGLGKFWGRCQPRRERLQLGRAVWVRYGVPVQWSRSRLRSTLGGRAGSCDSGPGSRGWPRGESMGVFCAEWQLVAAARPEFMMKAFEQFDSCGWRMAHGPLFANKLTLVPAAEAGQTASVEP